MNDNIIGSEFFFLFQAAITVYLLYGAISGKGQVYKNDAIKEEFRDAYNRITRIFCWIGGVVSGVMTLSDYLKWPYYVYLGLMVLMFALIGWFIIKTRPFSKNPPVKVKKEKKKAD